jgi:hypothetical protein
VNAPINFSIHVQYDDYRNSVLVPVSRICFRGPHNVNSSGHSRGDGSRQWGGHRQRSVGRRRRMPRACGLELASQQ